MGIFRASVLASHELRYPGSRFVGVPDPTDLALGNGNVTHQRQEQQQVRPW
ncbi:hypothetical protein [Actinomadura sp. 7K534]|uniref:hypothetical protein n=1 Tax=Actinomadura sp. 7K534 TaxID=2530366 RepID=UPI001404CF71|nr:hypothetical protein [Actinomadura sp. 7K534]